MTLGEMLLAAILPGIVTWIIIFRTFIEKNNPSWSNFWQTWWAANLAFLLWPIALIVFGGFSVINAIESMNVEKAISLCGGYSRKEKKAKKVLAK